MPAGLAAAFENAKFESALCGTQRKAQCGGRGVAFAARRTEQHDERAAPLGGELQAPQILVAHGGQPGKHCTAGVRADCLFGGPESIAFALHPYHQQPGKIDAGGDQRRCVRRVGGGNPCEAFAPTGQGGQGRTEKTHFADAFVSGQDFGERAYRPAIARQLGIEFGKSAGDTGKHGAREAVAAPDRRVLQQDLDSRGPGSGCVSHFGSNRQDLFLRPSTHA